MDRVPRARCGPRAKPGRLTGAAIRAIEIADAQHGVKDTHGSVVRLEVVEGCLSCNRERGARPAMTSGGVGAAPAMCGPISTSVRYARSSATTNSGTRHSGVAGNVSTSARRSPSCAGSPATSVARRTYSARSAAIHSGCPAADSSAALCRAIMRSPARVITGTPFASASQVVTPPLYGNVSSATSMPRYARMASASGT